MCSVRLLEFYVRGPIAQADHPAIALSTSEGEGAAPLEPALPPLQPLRPREVLRGVGMGGGGDLEIGTKDMREQPGSEGGGGRLETSGEGRMRFRDRYEHK